MRQQPDRWRLRNTVVRSGNPNNAQVKRVKQKQVPVNVNSLVVTWSHEPHELNIFISI